MSQPRPLLPIRPRFLTPLCVLLAVVLGLSALAASASTGTRDCGSGRFPGAITAKGTTCAVANHVETAFLKECPGLEMPAGQFAHCDRTVVGFKCRPSGDPYHVVNCTKNLAVVTFRPAESTANTGNSLSRAASIVTSDALKAWGSGGVQPTKVVVRRCGWVNTSKDVAQCVAYVIIYTSQNTYDPTPPYFSASCPSTGGDVNPYCDPNTADDYTPIPGSYSGYVQDASEFVAFTYTPPYSGPLPNSSSYGDDFQDPATLQQAITSVEGDEDQAGAFVAS